jgi:hypothetical protein
VPLSAEAESIAIFASDLFPHYDLPAQLTRQAYVFLLSPSVLRLTLLTSKNRDDTSSDMHICIPFTDVVETLQKACLRQLESDKKASTTEKKPRATKKHQLSDQAAGLDEQLRKKEQELRKKQQEFHKRLRKKDEELRKKDEELRRKNRKLRLAKRQSS